MIKPDRSWWPVYVGIGSNLNDPVRQVLAAFDGLASLPASKLVAVSDLYRNPPMGPQDQPDYVNAVAGLLSQLPPGEFLAALQTLEQQQGRVRAEGDRWGPRIIDLDLLVYGAQTVSQPGLELPHPGICERNFVLLPLCDIAPMLVIPGQGTVMRLAAGMEAEGLQTIDIQTRKRA